MFNLRTRVVIDLIWTNQWLISLNSNHYWTYLWEWLLDNNVVSINMFMSSVKKLLKYTRMYQHAMSQSTIDYEPLKSLYFNGFTGINHQISVITCKICKLVILHFQASHDTFLAYLYIHHIQHNAPSSCYCGIQIQNFSSKILVMVRDRW